MNCSFAGTTVCKLITDPANLLRSFQQKQLIVFSLPRDSVRCFCFLVCASVDGRAVVCGLPPVGGGRQLVEAGYTMQREESQTAGLTVNTALQENSLLLFLLLDFTRISSVPVFSLAITMGHTTRLFISAIRDKIQISDTFYSCLNNIYHFCCSMNYLFSFILCDLTLGSNYTDTGN